MLAAKTFEVRDAATFIPCVGVACWRDPSGVVVKQTRADTYLLGRAGYRESRCVLFTRLDANGRYTPASYDPFSWANNRTMQVAHLYVTENWDRLESGSVIDVESILGIGKEPKRSEAEEDPYA